KEFVIDERQLAGDAFWSHIVIPDNLTGKPADLSTPVGVEHLSKDQAGGLGVVFVAEVVVEVGPGKADVFPAEGVAEGGIALGRPLVDAGRQVDLRIGALRQRRLHPQAEASTKLSLVAFRNNAQFPGVNAGQVEPGIEVSAESN